MLTISVATDGAIWGVDDANMPQRHVGNGRFVAAGDRPMKMVSAGSSTQAWGLDMAGQPMSWQAGANGGAWQSMQVTDPYSEPNSNVLSHIDGAADGTVWAVGGAGAVRWYGNGWKAELWASSIQVAVASQDAVWVVDLEGSVRRATKTTSKAFPQWGTFFVWPPEPPLPNGVPAVGIAIGKDGVLRALGADNRMCVRSASGWTVTSANRGNPSSLAGLAKVGDCYFGSSINPLAARAAPPILSRAEFRLPASLIPVRWGSGPGIAQFNDRIYCAYRSDSNALSVTTSTDGGTWGPAGPIPGILIGGTPALAEFNGRLYCTFQANDPSNTLFVTSTADGVNWISPARGYPSLVAQTAPALAVFNNRLYCAFQAPDTSLSVTSSADGENWMAPARTYPDIRIHKTKVFGIDAFTGLALAVFNDKLYCAFRAAGTNTLSVISSADGENWTRPVAGPSDLIALAPPSLAVFENNLYCAYLSLDDNTLSVSRSYDGDFWAAPRRYMSAGSAPALGVYRSAVDRLGPRLYAAWGAKSGDTLYVSSAPA